MNSFDQDLELFGVRHVGMYYMDIEDEHLTYGDDLSSVLISKVLDFCSCGNPEAVLLEMSRVIKLFMDPKHDTPPDSDLIYLYVADRAELMEHGGSVYGAWVTEKGEAFIRLVEVAVKEEEEEDE